MPQTDIPKKARRYRRGFERTSTLVAAQIRAAGEGRGFAVSRLLTHWVEVVGEDVASVSRPVEVSYGRGGGFGGTLSILTTGAQAPMLEMQTETIRERVNACYGYAAISRVRITQTAPTGFAGGRADFDHAPKKVPQNEAPDPATRARAAKAAQDVTDPGLRAAIETLAGHVLSARHDTSDKG